MGRLGRKFALWVTVLVVVTVCLIRPFTLPSGGLDPSWSLVLEFGFLNNLVFGSDLIFTYGPLGFLYSNLFHPDTYLWSLAIQAALIIWWTAFFLNSRSHTIPIWSGALLSTLPFGFEKIYLVLPMACFLWLCRPSNAPLLQYMGWMLVGVSGAIKFSFVMLGLALALLYDLTVMLDRNWRQASATLLLVVGFAGAFLLVGQPLSTIPEFLANSLRMASGYSSAMGIDGPPQEILAFGFSSLALLLATFYWLKNSRLNKVRGASILLAIGCVEFFAFKAGFVRHDAHSLGAWGALIVLSMLIYIVTSQDDWCSKPSLCVLACLVLSLLLGSYAKSMQLAMRNDSRTLWSLNLEHIQNQLKYAVQFWDPNYFEQLGKARDIQEQRLRFQAKGIAKHARSADAIPWHQAGLVVSHLRYRPRPIFQSYSAYTPALIQTNVTAIETSPPDLLLFSALSIDERYPSLDDGALYPSVLSRYDPIGLQDNLVVLLKRKNPRGSLVLADEHFDVMPNEWVDVDDLTLPGTISVLKLEIKPTLLGRLQSFIFKPRLPMIEVRLANGTARQHRIVPDMASQGFVVSPYAAGLDVLSLFPGSDSGWSIRNHRVLAFRLTGDRWTWLNYSENIDASLQQITLDATVEHALPEAFSSKRSILESLMTSADYPHTISPSAYGSDGITTHADMSLKLDLLKAQGIQFSFGLQDGAWQQGRTDGISLVVGWQGVIGIEPIYTRVLNPLENSLDRGPQRVRLDFQRPRTGTLVFTFDKLANANWDWAYLSDVEVVR